MIIYYIYTSGNLETDILLIHTIKCIGNISFFYGFTTFILLYAAAVITVAYLFKNGTLTMIMCHDL